MRYEIRMDGHVLDEIDVRDDECRTQHQRDNIKAKWAEERVVPAKHIDMRKLGCSYK